MKMFYLLFLISLKLHAFEWVDGYQMHVITPSVSAAPQAVFFNSYTGAGAKINQWKTVNLIDVLPSNTVAIHVTGMLIITHGKEKEIADLKIYFRNNDSYDPHGNYRHQVIESSEGDGQRSTMSAWIALKDNAFQYKWEINNSLGTYPAKSSYGGNLVIDAFLTN